LKVTHIILEWQSLRVTTPMSKRPCSKTPTRWGIIRGTVLEQNIDALSWRPHKGGVYTPQKIRLNCVRVSRIAILKDIRRTWALTSTKRSRVDHPVCSWVSPSRMTYHSTRPTLIHFGCPRGRGAARARPSDYKKARSCVFRFGLTSQERAIYI
jgi:hypothetical protein